MCENDSSARDRSRNGAVEVVPWKQGSGRASNGLSKSLGQDKRPGHIRAAHGLVGCLLMVVPLPAEAKTVAVGDPVPPNMPFTVIL